MRLITTLLLALISAQALCGEVVRIAVAANFRGTLEQLNPAFEEATGHSVSLSSASTGVLYSQIIHGAPFDLFFAADRDRPEQLADRYNTESFCYARGRLVLVGGHNSLTDLADGSLSLAIANPQTAPYGEAAMEVLSRPEYAAAGNRKLVRGNNVAQAYQFWRTGAADLALVPAAIDSQGIPVPADWHRALDQHALLLPTADNKPAASAYLKWIRSDNVRAQITEAGYLPCP